MDVLVEPTGTYARRVTGVTVQKPAAGNELRSYFAAIQLLVSNTKRTSNIIGCGLKSHDFKLISAERPLNNQFTTL
ncbi:hypothetical protein SXM_0881 [Shewanella xiamenensis]|nr:hypothetical protein SXM_0881 [Shewanella xiamenensis]